MSRHHDPNRHHRHSIRLQGWDYRTPGAYFITICTDERANIFEDQHLRRLVESRWRAIPDQPRSRHVILDEWVVMPNHLHAILVLVEPEVDTAAPSATGRAAGRAATAGAVLTTLDVLSTPVQPRGANAGSVGAIVGTFKSLVTRAANVVRRTPGGIIWQRGYYDHIVRNERELNAIRQYILDNPIRWAEDRDNLDELLARMRLVV